MPRVKRGKTHVQRRNRLFKKAKGFKWGRKNTIRLARTAVTKAGAHAYVDRRKKKRVNRALWQIKIGAFVRRFDLSYSRFIYYLKSAKIELDRKILADLAENNQEILAQIVKQARAK